MRLIGYLLLCTMYGHAYAASACYRTVGEAALEAGVRDGVGFRLEGVRVDRLGGAQWANVQSCAHPERPGTLVRLAQPLPPAQPLLQATTTAVTRELLVHAGAPVRLVHFEANSRMELPGVAQTNGSAGDRILVRVNPSGAPEHFVAAVVRGAALVEMEAAQ